MPKNKCSVSYCEKDEGDLGGEKLEPKEKNSSCWPRVPRTTVTQEALRDHYRMEQVTVKCYKVRRDRIAGKSSGVPYSEVLGVKNLDLNKDYVVLLQ